MIIAIDGPSASGKGTLARRLAAHFGLAYLDSGALYRAVALVLLEKGIDPGDTGAAETAARALDLKILENPHIRDERTGEAASIVAAMPGVRAALLGFQRDFAHHPPPGFKGVVIDGRDIGTVVCPEAEFKLFVTASPETRAARRVQEMKERGLPANEQEIVAAIRDRDQRDKTRKNSPLIPAEDALLLDTTKLDIDGAFEKACAILKKAGLDE